MFSKLGRLFLCFSAACGCAAAQLPAFEDTVQSPRNARVTELVLDFPLGQTFFQPDDSSRGFSRITCIAPDKGYFPQKSSEWRNGIRMVSYLGLQGQSRKIESAGANAGKVQYSYRVTQTTGAEDGSKVISEFYADPSQLFHLSFSSGLGKSRLDLSGLKLCHLNMQCGASDVIITYSRPNQTEMESMTLNGGVGKIVVRNLEMARARKVYISNGVGATQLVIGNSCSVPSVITIDVGAGTCDVMVNPEVPMKVVVNQSFLSSVHLPDSFTHTGNNIYVNARFRAVPEQAVNMHVDVGVGSFNLISSGK